MAYSVPDLPYGYDALEPHIDEETMRIHHDKHHQAYVDKANAALEGTEWADLAAAEVLTKLDDLPDDKRRRRAQQRRRPLQPHALLGAWARTAAASPSGDLGDAINEAFGSFDDFKTKLKEAGVDQFGSGWAWLVHDGSGLAIVSHGEPGQPR